MHARRKEEVKEVWESHFQCLMNEKTERVTIVSSIDVEAGGKRVNVQQGIYRKEVKKAIDKIKCNKATGVDCGWNNYRNVIIWRRNRGRMDALDM